VEVGGVRGVERVYRGRLVVDRQSIRTRKLVCLVVTDTGNREGGVVRFEGYLSLAVHWMLPLMFLFLGGGGLATILLSSNI
jgi:hypothetical protein